MKAYKSLVKKALSLKYTVSVWDGEDWQLKRSTKQNTICDVIESVETCQLRFRDAEGSIVGWALIVMGNEDDELVADHTTYLEEKPESIKFKWMDDWWEEFQAAYDKAHA